MDVGIEQRVARVPLARERLDVERAAIGAVEPALDARRVRGGANHAHVEALRARRVERPDVEQGGGASSTRPPATSRAALRPSRPIESRARSLLTRDGVAEPL